MKESLPLWFEMPWLIGKEQVARSGGELTGTSSQPGV